MTDEKQVKARTKDDEGLLSEDTKIALRKKAKEIARKKAQEDAEDKFLEAETKKAEAEENVRNGITTNMEIVEHRINLGPSAKQIKINGQIYMHGVKYKLRKDVYDCIREVEYRTWMHEDSRQGVSDNPYKLQGRKISGRGGFVGGVAGA